MLDGCGDLSLRAGGGGDGYRSGQTKHTALLLEQLLREAGSPCLDSPCPAKSNHLQAALCPAFEVNTERAHEWACVHLSNITDLYALFMQ